MPDKDEYRTDAERFGDLLDKALDAPDPEISNLTEEEESELQDLWHSQGYDLVVGSYNHPERWINLFPSLGLPAQPVLTPVPVVAERAFLTLAREWLAEVEKAPKDCALPRTADMRALSCLFLAVESGSKFTDVARQQMEINREVAAARLPPSWIDQLPWKLCQSAFLMSPLQSDAVQKLTVNLDHHNSSIRCWMMKIGWLAIPWLNPVEATEKLLKNLADTLSGPFMAAGLAARLFDKEDDFLAFAHSFTPPDSFEEQYQNRLKRLEEHGIQTVQAPFWETEAICRQEIERAGLGFRIRKTYKHKM